MPFPQPENQMLSPVAWNAILFYLPPPFSFSPSAYYLVVQLVVWMASALLLHSFLILATVAGLRESAWRREENMCIWYIGIRVTISRQVYWYLVHMMHHSLRQWYRRWMGCGGMRFVFLFLPDKLKEYYWITTSLCRTRWNPRLFLVGLHELQPPYPSGHWFVNAVLVRKCKLRRLSQM